jgi:hypothetical protein
MWDEAEALKWHLRSVKEAEARGAEATWLKVGSAKIREGRTSFTWWQVWTQIVGRDALVLLSGLVLSVSDALAQRFVCSPPAWRFDTLP